MKRQIDTITIEEAKMVKETQDDEVKAYQQEINEREIKQILRRVRKLDEHIRTLEESKQRAFARVTSATQQISETGVHSDNQNDAMAQYVAFSEEIVKEIARLQRVQNNVFSLITKIKRRDLQTVLHLYYIDGYTWEEVAVKMHYSWRWVMKLHGKALQEITRVAQRNPALYSVIKGK